MTTPALLRRSCTVAAAAAMTACSTGAEPGAPAAVDLPAPATSSAAPSGTSSPGTSSPGTSSAGASSSAAPGAMPAGSAAGASGTPAPGVPGRDDDDVELEDQSGDGASVLVEEVQATEAGWVVVLDSAGTVLGTASVPVGEVRDVTIDLTTPVSATGELSAVLHRDDGDGAFDTATDPAVLEDDGNDDDNDNDNDDDNDGGRDDDRDDDDDLEDDDARYTVG